MIDVAPRRSPLAEETRSVSSAGLLRRLLAGEPLWIAGVVALSLVIVVPRYLMQLGFGPGWDAYTFLLNALEYAGQGRDYIEIYRPPLLPFIVSLFIRAGVDATWPLFFVDGAVTVLGVVGLYLLLRRALSRPVSVLGSLTFLALPDTVENLTAGVTDIISVAVSIWLVYFVVRALRDDPRFMTWAVLLVPVGFMSRFTAGLMAFVVVFALVYDGHLRRFAGPLRRGVLYSAILLAPYLAYHWWRFGDPLIQLGEPFRAATATSRVGMLAGVIEPKTFFLSHLPGMLATAATGWVLAALLVLGIALVVAGVVSRRSPRLTRRRSVVASVGLAAAAALVVGPTSFLPAVVVWTVVLGWMVPRWIAEDDDETTFLCALMLFWLALYLTVHSHMLVKVTRYYLTMAPPVVFLLVYPVERLRRRSRAASSMAEGPESVVALAAAFALVGLVAWGSFQRVPSQPMQDFSGYDAARTWIDTHVSASERAVTSDAYPALRYRLRRRIYPMPPFSGKDAHVQMARWLDTNGIRYFFTVHTYPPIPGFESVFRSGDISVYQRTSPRPDRPQVLLVGRAVDRHLNEALGKDAPYIAGHLPVIPDDYAGTDGAWIDEYTPAELRAYDAVYLYRFRWHDQAAAEKTLRSYVTAGGTVLIDASGNLGNPPMTPNGLEGASFLDVLVAREPVPVRAPVRVLDPALSVSGAAPVLGPFTAEEGTGWYAAAYEPVHPERMRTLVTYDDAPFVFEERLGAGRIVWVSGNLGFHAFLRGTGDERRLVRALLDYATTPANGGT